MTTVEKGLPQYQTRPYPIIEGVPPPSSLLLLSQDACVVSGGEDGSVFFYDVESGTLVNKLQAPLSASAGHTTRVY